MVATVPPNPPLRITNFIAVVFGACALAAVLLSVFVMASRPWGCSASSETTGVTCDWVTSRVVAAVWLVAALVVCLIAVGRRTLPLAVISAPLLAVSLISVIGVFSLAPAAFWFVCALWQWAQGRRSSIVVSTLASIVLLYLGTTGLLALLALYSTPN